MGLFDTHCHLDIESHFPDFHETLNRARQAGVCDMVLAGVYRKGWSRLLDLCREDPNLHAAPGLHPMYMEFHDKDDMQRLERVAAAEEIIAIGEAGLDYHLSSIDREAQQHLFEAQVDIAACNELPLLLHVRKAHDQVLSALRRKKFVQGGIVHAYSGSLQQAEQYIRLGFKIGICGTITYDRARKIRRVAAALPLDSLVLETDSPDLPPVRHHGERNSPEYLPEILESLTELRSEGGVAIARQTTRNARDVLGLKNLPR